MNGARRRWAGEVAAYDVAHRRLRQVAALVAASKARTVLDVGCGPGALARLLPGVRYTGIDFVAASDPAFEFFECDFNRSPLPSGIGPFDAVVCSGLLEYILDVPAFLESLRPLICGRLIATYFNMNHVSRIAALARGKTFPVHPTWKNFYSPRDFRKLLERAGLRAESAHATRHAVTTPRAVSEAGHATRPRRIRPWSDLLAHELIYVAVP